jgi:hypothetical protein
MNNLKIYNLLFEADEEKENKPAPENPVAVREPSVKARPANDSVDDQIDSLILRYENASIRSEEAEEASALLESLSSLDLKFLFEQDDEFEDEFEDTDDADDTGDEEVEDDTDDSPSGSEDMTVSEPADDQEVPPLDVDAFTGRVVRLIMNHKNLLRIEDAIVNRAKNFLDENYGDQFVNKYLAILEEQYGLTAEEHSDVSYPDDEVYAIGANPAGAGAMGGGGGV